MHAARAWASVALGFAVAIGATACGRRAPAAGTEAAASASDAEPGSSTAPRAPAPGSPWRPASARGGERLPLVLTSGRDRLELAWRDGQLVDRAPATTAPEAP